MRSTLVITADGSPTIYVPELNEHYHSVHGAVQESMHVFIRAGFDEAAINNASLYILEVGLGTGFNLLLTLNAVIHNQVDVTYHAIEPFPPANEILSAFTSAHLEQLGEGAAYFHALHQVPWEKAAVLHERFTLIKYRDSLSDFTSNSKYHLIYFDAFAPGVQPDMWKQEHFVNLFNLMHSGGILVTYCAKGDVRRAMQSAGFKVERLPGPPGKREMLRARKI